MGLNVPIESSMKRLTLILLGTLVLATTLPALEISQADKKWAEAVEKKLAAGAAEISTPSEVRVQIAKQMAAQKGRSCQVVKTSSGYRVVIK